MMPLSAGFHDGDDIRYILLIGITQEFQGNVEIRCWDRAHARITKIQLLGLSGKVRLYIRWYRQGYEKA